MRDPDDDIDDSMAANPEPEDPRAEIGYVAPTPRQPTLPALAPELLAPEARKVCVFCNEPPDGGVLVAVVGDIRRTACPKCAGKRNRQRIG